MFQGIFILFTTLLLQISFAAPVYSPTDKSILFQNDKQETLGYFNTHDNTLYLWTEIPRLNLPSWAKSPTAQGGVPSYGFLPFLGPTAKFNFLPGETFIKGLINKDGSLMIITEYFNSRLNRKQSLYILPQHPQFRGQRYLFSGKPQLLSRQCNQLFSAQRSSSVTPNNSFN